MTEIWENDIRAALANDPSVWSQAEAMAILDGAKREARGHADLFDWMSQEFTPAGIAWIRTRVL